MAGGRRARARDVLPIAVGPAMMEMDGFGFVEKSGKDESWRDERWRDERWKDGQIPGRRHTPPFAARDTTNMTKCKSLISMHPVNSVSKTRAQPNAAKRTSRYGSRCGGRYDSRCDSRRLLV